MQNTINAETNNNDATRRRRKPDDEEQSECRDVSIVADRSSTTTSTTTTNSSESYFTDEDIDKEMECSGDVERPPAAARDSDVCPRSGFDHRRGGSNEQCPKIDAVNLVPCRSDRHPRSSSERIGDDGGGDGGGGGGGGGGGVPRRSRRSNDGEPTACGTLTTAVAAAPRSDVAGDSNTGDEIVSN